MASTLLNTDEIQQRLQSLNSAWVHDSERNLIHREFRFPGYADTMTFANAVAWIAQQQDHHPDMHIGYNRCRVEYSTHSVGGLSELDFAAAARVDALLDQA